MQSQDLQAVLANLAQYSQPSLQSNLRRLERPADVTNVASGSGIAQDENASLLTELTTSPTPKASTDPRLRPQSTSRTALPPKTVIDPATITNWQEGLRCVTKIAAQNKVFEDSIRRMMRDQRAHELRWYTERQALKQNQVNRAASSAQALSIIKALNQDATEDVNKTQSEDEKLGELSAFDQKIYTAQLSMETAMSAELKGLGVPFFGMSEELICKDNVDPASLVPSSDPTRHSKPVTEQELLAMRRRMVAHLEDLYRD